MNCSFTAVSSTSIEANIFENGGIKFKSTAADVIINDNTIESDGMYSGIDFISRSGGEITNNTITLPTLPYSGKEWNTDTTAVCAIKVNSISFPGVFSNKIEGGSYGIYLSAISARAINNTVSNSGNGIYIETVACPVDSNQVHSNSNEGIIIDEHPEIKEYSDTTSVPMRHNIIAENGGNGIRLLNNANLFYNTLTNNGGYDLYVETPSSIKKEIIAKNNFWDHDTLEDIDSYDIYDDDEDNSKSTVIFQPFILHPGIPELISPINHLFCPDSTQMLFIWNKDLQSETYDLELASDSIFNTTIITNESYADTTYFFKYLESGKDYYWRVRGRKMGFAGEWSDVRIFSTSPPTGTNKIGFSTSSNHKLKVFPNPAKGVISISIQDDISSDISISIYSIQGNLLKTLKKSAKNETLKINVSDLPSGVCFCQIARDNYSTTQKIIIKN